MGSSFNYSGFTGASDGPAVSTVPAPTSTGLQSTQEAIQAGNLAYSQLPGYASDVAGVGKNVSSEIAGQLPASVIQQLQQQGAERGISTGSPGSPNSNASYMQALGLNSLQLTNTGQQNLNTATQNLPGGAISQNPGFYVTPALQQQAASQNASMQTDANANAAALNAAKAGLAAGGAPTTTYGPSSLPTLASGAGGASATNPFYAPPNVGWGSNGPQTNPTGASTMQTITGILNDYAGTVDPAQEAPPVYMGASTPTYQGEVDNSTGEAYTTGYGQSGYTPPTDAFGDYGEGDG